MCRENMFLILFITHLINSDSGAWFGDPASHTLEGRRIWIAGEDLKTWLDRVVGSKSPDSLTLALLSILFSREEIADDNVTHQGQEQQSCWTQKSGPFDKLTTLVVSSYLCLANPLVIFCTTHCTCSCPQCLISQVMSSMSSLNLILKAKKLGGSRFRQSRITNAEILKRLKRFNRKGFEESGISEGVFE